MPGHFGFHVNTVACVQVLPYHMDSQKEVKWIPSRSLFMIRQLVIVNDSWEKIVVFCPCRPSISSKSNSPSDTFAKLGKASIRFIMSFCRSSSPSAWNNSPPNRRIFKKFDILTCFENPPRKVNYHQNLARIMGILHEDQCTFFIINSLSSS